ncbi:antitoxin VbhA family protein [Bartonella taylorii]|uniref:antitoxin VbhA family protein n=1 Tax=Bartonella taylorii TaxID=33046 RepID=UPI001ABBCBF5|nr:antitoxin VbhA family protein [Bartonella taylorii]
MEAKEAKNLSSVTPEEFKKRREAVNAAISSYALEGITLHPTTLKILEEYAKGHISLEEFNFLMDNAIL